MMSQGRKGTVEKLLRVVALSLSLFSHSCTHAFAHTQSLSHQQTHSLSLSLVHSNLCVCACANPRFIVFLSEGKHWIRLIFAVVALLLVVHSLTHPLTLFLSLSLTHAHTNTHFPIIPLSLSVSLAHLAERSCLQIGRSGGKKAKLAWASFPLFLSLYPPLILESPQCLKTWNVQKTLSLVAKLRVAVYFVFWLFSSQVFKASLSRSHFNRFNWKPIASLSP